MAPKWNSADSTFAAASIDFLMPSKTVSNPHQGRTHGNQGFEGRFKGFNPLLCLLGGLVQPLRTLLGLMEKLHRAGKMGQCTQLIP